MKLEIKNGVLFADNFHICYCEAGNGCDSLQPGRYPVTTQYSSKHGQELPVASGLGWFGPAISGDGGECDIVLGRVQSGNGIVPCSAHVGRLLAMLDTAESAGKSVELVVS